MPNIEYLSSGSKIIANIKVDNRYTDKHIGKNIMPLIIQSVGIKKSNHLNCRHLLIFSKSCTTKCCN